MRATTWYHCGARDSKIRKMSANNIENHSFARKVNKTVLHGLSISNRNFSEFALLAKISPQIRICGFQYLKQFMS